MGTSCESSSTNGEKEIKRDMWHGSVNTSTDTLVPIDTKSQNGSTVLTPMGTSDLIGSDTTDAGESIKDQKHNGIKLSTTNTQKPETEQLVEEKCKSASVSTNCKILPKVHTSLPSNNITRTNQLSSNDGTLVVPTSLPSSTAPTEISNNIPKNLISSKNDNKLSSTSISEGATYSDPSVMEESILILPEHQKLEISFSGKCEMVAANATTSLGPIVTSEQPLTSTSSASNSVCVKTTDDSTTVNATENPLEPLTTGINQRRRRTSTKQINSRFA